MNLFVIFLVIYIVWKVYQSRQGYGTDELGRVLGEATEYDDCPMCAKKNCQSPRGTGEVFTRGGNYLVRQYHVCLNCGVKSLWHRRLDLWVWTINRNGVAD